MDRHKLNRLLKKHWDLDFDLNHDICSDCEFEDNGAGCDDCTAEELTDKQRKALEKKIQDIEHTIFPRGFKFMLNDGEYTLLNWLTGNRSAAKCINPAGGTVLLRFTFEFLSKKWFDDMGSSKEIRHRDSLIDCQIILLDMLKKQCPNCTESFGIAIKTVEYLGTARNVTEHATGWCYND